MYPDWIKDSDQKGWLTGLIDTRSSTILLCLIFFSAGSVIAQDNNNLFSLDTGTNIDKNFTVRGQLSPLYHTVLSSELAANVQMLELREGDEFKKDQLIAELNCTVYRAKLKNAVAAVETARLSYDVNQRLAQLDANSVMDMEQAAAKLSEAEAWATVMGVTVNKCEIRAPFSGHVVKRLAEPHQYVKPGDPLLEIHSPDKLEIRLIVPSRWMIWLTIGSRLQFHVEENDTKYAARVVRIGTQVDPVSQTIPLAAKIEKKHPELLPGMSGSARFNPLDGKKP